MEVYELYYYYFSVAECFTQDLKRKLFKKYISEKRRSERPFFMNTNEQLYHFQTDI